MTATLYLGGSVYCHSDPFATALLVVDGVVAWIGQDGAARAHASSVDAVVDLDGALVAPAFVDAHLHITATGMTELGLDLTGATSLAEVLSAVASASPTGGTIIGFGWDERGWPEQRPPTRAELDQAADGAKVLLDRLDVHSSVVSSALIDAHPEAVSLEGFDHGGWLRGIAHDTVRSAVYADLPAALRQEAQRRVRRQAAAAGIAALHEMGGPELAGQQDLRDLLAIASDEPGPEVLGYWALLDGSAQSRALGARGVGGDLYVDGTVGSHSAFLREPYADVDSVGDCYLSPAQVAAQIVVCAHENLQAGFHVIGDAALDIVLDGLDEAAQRVGAAAVRAGRHRLEHVELVHPEQIRRMAGHGIVASVQPRFDEHWGGPDGMYAERLGSRWTRMNPFADMVAGGVALAFGSDSPVTAIGPWEAVRAAAHHHVPGQRMTVRSAFSAHTRGGWRAAGVDGGIIDVGAPAHLAIWRAGELLVQTPDSTVAAWSTDPRAGIAGLPDLSDGAPAPTCLRTIVGGHTVFDAGLLG